MSERCVEVLAVGLALELSKSADALFERLRPILQIDETASARVIVFPEFSSLVLAEGASRAQIKTAELEFWTFQSLVAKELRAYVCAALPVDMGPLVVQQATIVDHRGKQILSVVKEHLTEEEMALGLMSGTGFRSPLVETEAGTLGVAICFDAFSAEYLKKVGEVDFLLMPSANPQKWEAPARKSGRWQPDEWLDALDQAALFTGGVVVNPMLHGRFGEVDFDGQSTICTHSPDLIETPFRQVERPRQLRWLDASPPNASGDVVARASVKAP